MTPTIREDRRRFALWTASRAQTFVFQSRTEEMRTRWVRAINELLSEQLRRLRDDVQKKHSALFSSNDASSHHYNGQSRQLVTPQPPTPMADLANGIAAFRLTSVDGGDGDPAETTKSESEEELDIDDSDEEGTAITNL